MGFADISILWRLLEVNQLYSASQIDEKIFCFYKNKIIR